jgi:hypothetical protein
MKKALFLLAMAANFLVGCNMNPAAPSEVSSSPTRISSEFFTLVKGSAGFDLGQDHADAADQKWRQVAACLGADSSIAKGYVIRLWAVDKKLPCGGGGCISGSTLDLYEAYTTWDQGWRHEFIHMALKEAPELFPEEDWRNCPATADPRIQQKPWSCQFDWMN